MVFSSGSSRFIARLFQQLRGQPVAAPLTGVALTATLAGLLAVSFVACGDDDDDANTGTDAGDTGASTDGGTTGADTADGETAGDDDTNPTTGGSGEGDDDATDVDDRDTSTTDTTTGTDGASGDDDATDTSAAADTTTDTSGDTTDTTDTGGTGDTTGDGTDTDDTTDTGSTNPVFVSGKDPFTTGSAVFKKVELKSGTNQAPKDLTVWFPNQSGEYAVLVFQHGFLGTIADYTDLIEKIVKHGFIVIAPQMYPGGALGALGAPNSDTEIADAKLVLGWVRRSVQGVIDLNQNPGIPLTIKARTDKLGLVGHSRGGKVSFGVAKDATTKIQAWAGVDPVDAGSPIPGAQGNGAQADAPVSFAFPSLVLGMGQGSVSPNFFTPACAPTGENYDKFYGVLPTGWSIVFPDAGHADVTTSGLQGFTCATKADKEKVKVATAGALVSYFQSVLAGNTAAEANLTDATKYPLTATVANK
jgi:chlorophyllase